MVDLTTLYGDRFIAYGNLDNLKDEAQAEIDELEEIVADLESDEDANELELADAQREVAVWKEENEKMFDELCSVVDELSRDDNLIADHQIDAYLQDEVDQLCPEVGDLPNWVVVDWESTYDNLKQDYSELTYGGDTYWYRAS